MDKDKLTPIQGILSKGDLQWEAGAGGTDGGMEAVGAVVEGKKFDQGKLQWHTINPLMEQIEQVVKILEDGVKTYGLNNWMNVTPFEERYSNALMRHVTAYMKGEITDPNSCRHHLAHAICNCLFLMHGGNNNAETE